MPIACWNAISPAATARRYWIVTTVATGRSWLSDSGTARCSAEAGRQQIKLGGVRAARLRLDVPHGREIALQLAEQRCFGAALQDLCQKTSARAQHLAGELGRCFHKRYDLELIGFLVDRRVRRHVGEDNIRATIERRAQPLGRTQVEEIELHEIDARNRLHFED